MRFHAARALAVTTAIVAAACAPRESDARPDTVAPTVEQPAARAGADSVVATTVGDQHACALTASGAAYCWGSNEDWQLGADLPASAPEKLATPVAVAGGHRFRAIAAGTTVTCAIDADGKAWCWGWGPEGRLGTGKLQDTAVVPKAVTGGIRFTAIGAGDRHACGLDADGAAWCWGANQYGMLGDSARPRASAAPVRVAGGRRYRQISVGARTTCATATDATAWCWGSNSSGELGDSTPVDNAIIPAQVRLDGVAEIHTAAQSTCALDRSGAVWCWGAPGARLVDGPGGDPVRSPQRVASVPPSVSRLSVGPGQACVVNSTGDAHCWGSAASAVAGTKFSSISIGGLVCGRSLDGNAYCWGRDLITEDAIATPRKVVFPP